MTRIFPYRMEHLYESMWARENLHFAIFYAVKGLMFFRNIEWTIVLNELIFLEVILLILKYIRKALLRYDFT